MTPPLLKWRYTADQAARQRPASPGPSRRPQPAATCRFAVRRHRGRGRPRRPATRGARPAAGAGGGAARGRRPPLPGAGGWLGPLGDDELRWQPRAAPALFAVLRDGNARSWRFLHTTGVLERVLPELADALRSRQADPFEVDPAATHHLSPGGTAPQPAGARPAAPTSPGSTIRSGCSWPGSWSRRWRVGPTRWPSPAGSCDGSTSAPRPRRRSRCSSPTATCCGPPPVASTPSTRRRSCGWPATSTPPNGRVRCTC